jgi:hypothetical protein
MQQQPIPPMSETEKEDHMDGVILEFLLDDDAQRPWTEDEVSRVVEHSTAACDSLGRLDRAGLIHRCGGFVFASRAALRAAQIAQ